MNARKVEDWIETLSKACKEDSQKAVADRIGYSPTVVNQVLKGAYKGDLAAVELAVRGALMNKTVDCPVIGPLPTNRCLEIQKQPFAATNPQRVRLFQACRTCPHAQRRH